MPVNTPCKEYNKNKESWFKCRTVAGGEEAVKDAGVRFLPALTEQSPNEYSAYKERALFYGATGRTVEGLQGAIFRKPPLIQEKEGRVKKELSSVTQDYQDCDNFASSVVHEIIVTGRLGILVDAPSNRDNGIQGPAYIALYQTEAIINWRYADNGDGLQLSLVVLEEDFEEPTEDEFVQKTKKQYRVLELFEGTYRQRVFRPNDHSEGKGKTVVEYEEDPDFTVVPTVGNQSLSYIPFIFVNPVDNTSRIYDSPILALANVNLSHYRSSADLEHGRHFTGLPTAWVAGFEKEEIFRIGSQVAWVSDQPDAHAGFLEFTGQGLQSLENALKEKQEMMAVLGARMLEDPKKAVESDSTLTTRFRGENNILSSISKTVSSALSVAFTWLMEWRGMTKEINVLLNTDFINDRLSPEQVAKLMESWQGGAMSWEVLFFNYKRGEIYPDDIDMEEERQRIEEEVPLDARSYTAAVPGEGEIIDEELEEEEPEEGSEK